MPILAIIDEASHGSLDESLKGLYKQNSEDKQFYLDISPDEAGKVAFNLQTEKQKLADNNAALLKQKGEAVAKLKPFESFGKSAEEIKTALEANRPEEVTKLVTDYEAKIQSLQQSFDESLKKETEARGKAQSILEKTLVDSQISKLRAEFDLNDTADFVLREFIKPQRNDETGDIATVVYENGNPALVAGQPKSPEQLLTGFREAKKYLSIFNAGTGGGTGGSNRQTQFNNSKTIKRSEYDSLMQTNPAAISKLMKDGHTIVPD